MLEKLFLIVAEAGENAEDEEAVIKEKPLKKTKNSSVDIGEEDDTMKKKRKKKDETKIKEDPETEQVCGFSCFD